MSVRPGDDIERVKERLYLALKHEKSCTCGRCSGGLNAVDDLVRRVGKGEALAWLVLAFTEETDEERIPSYEQLAVAARAALESRP